MASKTRQTDRRLATILAAPVGMTTWVVDRVKRMFAAPPTPKAARAAEKARRKEIRRGLRGLKKAA